MKKWVLLIGLAAAGLAIIPDTSDACFRRRCRPVPCPPVVVCPVCPLYPPAPVPPAGAMVKIKGKTYRLLDAADQGQFEEKTRPATITALVTQLLTKFPDAKMAGMGITKTTDTRVDAEKRNVRVTGFIHAFKKEGDHDYHMILGDGPNADNPVYLNVEVSGIPVGGTNANRMKLIAVRDEFKQAFNLGKTGPAGYKQPVEPIAVRITGSLFWDVDHAPGVVGPGNLKPKTSWEIHPVSAIEFLEPSPNPAGGQTNGQPGRQLFTPGAGRPAMEYASTATFK
jgi:hypothetical protein